ADREHRCCIYVYTSASCPAGLCKCWEMLVPGNHMDGANLFQPFHGFAGLDTVESCVGSGYGGDAVSGLLLCE
ncbi:hypothetical protein MKX01_030124, partial [Papaver californicum]